MLQTIIPLSKKFISIKSTADNTKTLEKILELALSYLTGYTIERFERNGVKSALIYNKKRRPKKFKIILNVLPVLSCFLKKWPIKFLIR